MQPYNANTSYVFGEYQKGYSSEVTQPRTADIIFIIKKLAWDALLRIPFIWVKFESAILEIEEIPINTLPSSPLLAKTEEGVR